MQAVADDGRVAIKRDLDRDIGKGIFAFGDRFDVVAVKTTVVAGDAVDCLEDRIDGPAADTGIHDHLFTLLDAYSSTWYTLTTVHQL